LRVKSIHCGLPFDLVREAPLKWTVEYDVIKARIVIEPTATG
jgi:hypothetical protein